MYMLSLVSASSVIILFLDTNSPKLSQDCIINVSCYYPLHCKPCYSAISCGESRLFLDLACGCYALLRKVGSLSLTYLCDLKCVGRLSEKSGDRR